MGGCTSWGWLIRGKPPCQADVTPWGIGTTDEREPPITRMPVPYRNSGLVVQHH